MAGPLRIQYPGAYYHVTCRGNERLVTTPEGNLSVFMRHFNISYTSAFNRRHRRVGHLYQGRYMDICQRGKRSLERTMLMELLYRFCQISQPEIGMLVGGIDYSAVSQARKRWIWVFPNVPMYSKNAERHCVFN